MAGKVQINQFNMGGISDSKYIGREHSFAKMIGVDVHSSVGVLQASQALTKESASTVDSLVKNIVVCSTGVSYHFSYTAGDIWERDEHGNWSLVYTTVPTTGEAGCLGAMEFNGFIYWATQNYLHRIPLYGTSNWTTNAVANWEALNLDQDISGAVTDKYATAVAITENAANSRYIVPSTDVMTGVAISVDTKGTGDWTVVLHDSANTEMATSTIATALMTNAITLFEFTDAASVTIGDTYHIHINTTVADGEVDTTAHDDLTDSYLEVYTSSDYEYHPMEVQNQVLYIGDRQFVHQVEDGVFTEWAVDIPSPYRVKCLGKYDTDLLIGTIIDDVICKAMIYRWNTWSVSWTNEDVVDEVGINSFIPVDNATFVQAGISGNIYYYDGSLLQLYQQVPGEYTDTKYGSVNPKAAVSFKGIPLFGFSNGDGNPAEQGVYSLGTKNQSLYPRILVLEYLISTGRSEDITIGAMAVFGSNLMVAWEDGAAGSTFGVDVIDMASKEDGAYVETLVMIPEREEQKVWGNIRVGYTTLPANCDIEIYVKQDYATSWGTKLSTKDDTTRKMVYAETRLDAVGLQCKIVLRTSGNDTPIIDEIQIIIE